MRWLRAVPADPTPAGVRTMADAVAAALDGTGPAVVPLPGGPPQLRDAVAAMSRMDLPLGDPDGLSAQEAGDVVLVVPTSGSTGGPKGALLTRQALVHSARAAAGRLAGPGRWLLALPTTHVAGLQVVVRAVLADQPPVSVDLTDGFRPEAFVDATRTLQQATRTGAPGGERPLYTSLVPTQLARLLDAGRAAVEALRCYAAVLVGAAATPPTLHAQAVDAGVRVVTTYGMTETCGGCVYDGVPLGGVHVAVDDDGRIRLGGPVVFAGYRARPDLTAAARLVDDQRIPWHRTRDLGRLDPADGRLTVLGRADDVITTGGEHVVPSTVEDALVPLPEVAEAAVVGVPDPRWGERVTAVVVPADPARPLDVAQVRQRLRGVLPAAALPRALVTTPRLPLLASGKPDRAALRDLARATMPA